MAKHKSGLGLTISGILKEFRGSTSYAGRGAAIRTAKNNGIDASVRYENGFTAIVTLNGKDYIFDIRGKHKKPRKRVNMSINY